MDVKKVAVVGSGIMGRGIAQAASFAGLEVSLYDINQELLNKALSAIQANIETHLVQKGKIPKQKGEEIVNRIHIFSSLEETAHDADFVIEAVSEDLELKKITFSKLDSICPSHAILATNTSVLPVTAIAGTTKRPEQCIGTHFFNPAVVMKLVEVVLPIGVSEETVSITIDLCEKMGKVPVKVKDIPGFIVNRLIGLLYQEAAQIVLEGTATAEEVDTAMRLGAGHPMGPCELADFGGFDVIQMAQDAIFGYTHRESDRLNILYRKMLEAGRLGRKNGKGFYDYLADGSKKEFNLFQV
jgi:3-hydroxybutyryl-CoA dehydrogenase